MSVIKLKPIAAPGLKDSVVEALRAAIAEMDIYGGDQPPRLDERKLAEDLGVSRTPIREAISCLEREGLVVAYPRRGAFVVRKTKAEILEIISVWAALEGMAARLATQHATDAELASMRRMFVTFDSGNEARANIDEYSKTNIEFHQRIIQLSKSKLLAEITDGLFIHMRAIRRKTIGERDRAAESVIDHMRIIEALEARDATRSERLVREHAMYLGDHVRRHVDYLN
ncbi:MAG: GntR family transcriptional regulator [Gammaproteobacteria bacterium]|nr:GntR family transcriptional regulator [Gammaproteobacteria bacterium]